MKLMVWGIVIPILVMHVGKVLVSLTIVSAETLLHNICLVHIPRPSQLICKHGQFQENESFEDN